MTSTPSQPPGAQCTVAPADAFADSDLDLEALLRAAPDA